MLKSGLTLAKEISSWLDQVFESKKIKPSAFRCKLGELNDNYIEYNCYILQSPKNIDKGLEQQWRTELSSIIASMVRLIDTSKKCEGKSNEFYTQLFQKFSNTLNVIKESSDNEFSENMKNLNLISKEILISNDLANRLIGIDLKRNKHLRKMIIAAELAVMQHNHPEPDEMLNRFQAIFSVKMQSYCQHANLFPKEKTESLEQFYILCELFLQGADIITDFQKMPLQCKSHLQEIMSTMKMHYSEDKDSETTQKLDGLSEKINKIGENTTEDSFNSKKRNVTDTKVSSSINLFLSNKKPKVEVENKSCSINPIMLNLRTI